MIVVECAGCGRPVQVGDASAVTYKCAACGTSAPLPVRAANAVHASQAYSTHLGRTARDLATSLVFDDIRRRLRFTVFGMGGLIASFYVIGLLISYHREESRYWVSTAALVLGAALAITTPMAILATIRRLEVWALRSFALPAIPGPRGMSCASCGGPLPEAAPHLAALRCRHCRAPNLLPKEAVAAVGERLDTAAFDAGMRKHNTEAVWSGLLLVGVVSIFLIPATSIGGCVAMTLKGDVIDRALAPVLYDEPDPTPRRYILLGSPQSCWVHEVDEEGRVRGMLTDGQWSENRLESFDGLVRAEDLVGTEGTGSRVVRVYGSVDANRAVLVHSSGALSRVDVHELALRDPELPIHTSFHPERPKRKSRGER